MNVYHSLADVPDGFGPSAATIGVFDGVHRGHRALMRTVLEHAAERDLAPVVVTFDRHPLEVIAPGKQPPLISTLPQRAREIDKLGIDTLVVLKFDDVFRHLSPEEFIVHVLVERLRCAHVVVGANFRFGLNQAGTIETLRALGTTHGFDVTVYDLVGYEDEVISSSVIRGHISNGNVERAAEELDRPYRLEGYVEHGAGRGHDLGFPTANLRVPARMLLPKLGVYAGWLIRGDERLPAVTNVGVNPTFGDRSTPIVEVHVLDFKGDLYGEVVEIEFTHRLRDELKFDDVDALIRQMEDDVVRTRRVLGLA